MTATGERSFTAIAAMPRIDETTGFPIGRMSRDFYEPRHAYIPPAGMSDTAESKMYTTASGRVYDYEGTHRHVATGDTVKRAIAEAREYQQRMVATGGGAGLLGVFGAGTVALSSRR